MGDAVNSAGSAPPANQATNAGNSGAASPDAALFGDVLKQESSMPLCPEGLHRPHKDDAPCTYLRNPSQPPQPSQSVDPHQVQGNPDRFKSPMTRSNGGDDYKKPTPKLEEKGVKVPDGPKAPSSMVPGDKAHLGGWGWPF
jgi:hypothetical protein